MSLSMNACFCKQAMLQSLPEHLPYQASSLLRSVLGHVAVRYDVLKKITSPLRYMHSSISCRPRSLLTAVFDEHCIHIHIMCMYVIPTRSCT